MLRKPRKSVRVKGVYHSSEIRNGEVFVANTAKGIEDHLKSLKTLRLGKLALDINGAELDSIFQPMFISKKELNEYDKLMTAHGRVKLSKIG